MSRASEHGQRRDRVRIAAELLVCVLALPMAVTARSCFGQAAVAGQAAAAHNEAAAAQLHQAIAAAEHGDLAGALAQADSVTARYPRYAPGVKFKGAMLEEAGRPQEAEACYERALALAPADGELLTKTGIYELLAGHGAEAISLFQRKLKAEPRDAETLFYLAQAYHLTGDNDQALKTIARAVKLDPADPPVLEKYGELLCTSGDNTAALEWLEKARSADPKLERIELDLAIASYRNQDLDRALEYAKAAVEREPNSLAGLLLLADVEGKLSAWADAMPVYERVLRLKPDDPAALIGLGHCQLALKQYQASVDTLQQLLRQDSTVILAHFYLARAYAGLGQRADADHEAELHARLVDQAGSVVPRDEREVEKATLVEARQLLTEGDEKEAIALFRARSKGPTATPGQPYVLTGVVYLYMGRAEDAERLLLEAIKVEPGVHQAHTYLGLLALEQRDLDKAEAEFRTELREDPNAQLAVAEIGEVRYRQQQWQAAADQLAESKTVSPALLYMLSDSYFHLGRVKDADLTAELALGYAKDDADGARRIIDLLNQNQQTDLAKRLSDRTNRN